MEKEIFKESESVLTDEDNLLRNLENLGYRYADGNLSNIPSITKLASDICYILASNLTSTLAGLLAPQ